MRTIDSLSKKHSRTFATSYNRNALPNSLRMNFRTELTISPSDIQIDYNSQILSMGSCFADRMGERLASAKFSTVVNPLGIAYNPVALVDLLLMAMGHKDLPEPTYSEAEEVWQSLAVHSQFNHPNKESYQKGIREALSHTHDSLKQASLLILTFGTAMVYRRQDTHEIVNNCQRFPASFFSKELLRPDEIIEALTDLTQQLDTFNPSIKILLTVSPIRHIKDSLSLNAVSKASLRLACHELSTEWSQISYFPAYEIMMDDLRDYRYYREDLIHPTDFAEQYIWDQFVHSHLTSQAQTHLKIWQQVQQDLGHRPRNPHSARHQAFLIKTRKKLMTLSQHIDCSAELRQVEKALASRDEHGG